MPELLKIQNNLVWQVSPHMASLEPPRLYAGSFWSHPYKPGAAKELLQNQEASLFRDIRDAINKRIQNRISTARRFAVSIKISTAQLGSPIISAQIGSRFGTKFLTEVENQILTFLLLKLP